MQTLYKMSYWATFSLIHPKLYENLPFSPDFKSHLFTKAGFSPFPNTPFQPSKSLVWKKCAFCIFPSKHKKEKNGRIPGEIAAAFLSEKRLIECSKNAAVTSPSLSFHSEYRYLK